MRYETKIYEWLVVDTGWRSLYLGITLRRDSLSPGVFSQIRNFVLLCTHPGRSVRYRTHCHTIMLCRRDIPSPLVGPCLSHWTPPCLGRSSRVSRCDLVRFLWPDTQGTQRVRESYSTKVPPVNLSTRLKVPDEETLVSVDGFGFAFCFV